MVASPLATAPTSTVTCDRGTARRRAGHGHREVKKLNVQNLYSGILFVFLVYLWIAVTVSVALLGLLFVLLFPRAADASAAAGRKFWPTVGWGALVGIVGPVLAVLVLVTIVGIPFGLGMLSALNVLAPLGYVASPLILGRLMVKGTSTGARIGAFFAGFGILRAVALIPGIGIIVWVLVCMYGLGALTQAAWRGGSHGSGVAVGRARGVAHPPARAPPARQPHPERPADRHPGRYAFVTVAPGSRAASARRRGARTRTAGR